MSAPRVSVDKDPESLEQEKKEFPRTATLGVSFDLRISCVATAALLTLIGADIA